MGISRMMRCLVVSCLLLATACSLASEVEMLLDDEQHLPGGEVVQVLKKASCKNAAKAGDKLTMDYTGIISKESKTGVKGKKFDSSLDRGVPFSFMLGQGQVIKGWDQGLVGICPGEQRKLTIPPQLGYGDQGAGGAIPGGATLEFTVTCRKVGQEESAW